MRTEDKDEELEYGRMYVHSVTDALEEESNLLRPEGVEDIWPHWNDGVPAKFRRKLGSPAFVLGGVQHHYREYYESLDLRWNGARKLSFLRKNYDRLPAANYKSQWSGVYRIFAPDTTIDRFCGRDPTGTLYLGRAGNGGRNWSILRTRIMAVVKKEHHATRGWDYSNVIQQKFPWESLAIEWAFTGERISYNGEPVAVAPLAEAWLLSSYNDSYGELPPLNQKG